MKNIKSVAFISILSLFCVISLTYFYEYSKPIIKENEQMDDVKNVLYSFNIDFSEDMARENIRSLFEESVEKKEIEGLTYYIHEKGEGKKYSFPIFAKGLWGLIYGFISLNSDLKTVYRITFSKHQETPGLGAQIDEEAYKKKYHDLSLYDKEGNFGIISKKTDGKKFINSVDSITGATLSSEAVVKGVNESLKKYLNVLK